MFYYTMISSDDVDSPIIDAAMRGHELACRALGIDGTKIGWYKPVTQFEWTRNGNIPQLKQSESMVGFFNKYYGIFLNRDMSISQVYDCIIHEVYHHYQYLTGQLPKDRAMTDEERTAFENDAETFTRQLLEPRPRPLAIMPHIIRLAYRKGIRFI